MTAVVETPGVEARLDRLSAQVSQIAEDLRRQRESREQWADLAQTLTPVSRQAFDLASRELDDLSVDVTADDAIRFARTLARSLPQMEALLAQLQSVTELAGEVTSLSGAGVARLSGALAEAEAKGYFTFARQGLAMADTVVTSFTEDDLRALGDNLVLILQTVKEMTQPEVMTLLRRTAVTAQHADDSYAEPPSTLALLRQMRDPDVRRGLARTLSVLRTVGAEQAAGAPNPTPAIPRR